MPRRIVITGANGSGKSTAARALGPRRPDLSVVSYDAIRLTEHWVKRPEVETADALRHVLTGDSWLIEGGPSMLAHALPRADAVLWLDPPDLMRAWRLALRPWRHRGRTRPDLPEGNVDWPLEQYRFAWKSLRRSSALRATIRDRLSEHGRVTVWHCRYARDVTKALETLGAG